MSEQKVKRPEPALASSQQELNLFSHLKNDIPSGVVVFLVALPLCLGIALASKGEVVSAPLFSGLLAGIIGGLVIPLISRSPLSVSGPAAGLIAIVISGMDSLGSWEAFLVAVFLGGLLQIGLGFFKAGAVAYFFPNSVIKGMLAAIGIILIRKQLPHALGIDTEAVDGRFHLVETHHMIEQAISNMEVGAFFISILSLVILILWENKWFKKIYWLPGALVVVVIGIIINQVFVSMGSHFALQGGDDGHLVNLPEALVNNGPVGFLEQLRFPDFSTLANPQVYVVALTIGLVASVETLLSVEAVDKLDPHKRQTPLNRELIAQGTANSIAGLIGGLPITAVIVRSSANVNSGGKTRMAALLHGVFLLGSVVSIAFLLNMIPLASLAAILLLVGYKLARPSLWKLMYNRGMNEFVPFAVTVVAVLVTDLLIGIGIGTAVGIFYIIKANFHTAIKTTTTEDTVEIKFAKDVSFLNKAELSKALNAVPRGKKVIIDGTQAEFIDNDIREILYEFHVRADDEGIPLEFRGVGTLELEDGLGH
ncbi:MAG: SulP family inorganic anion transporter [Bacteroidia bacterium]